MLSGHFWPVRPHPLPGEILTSWLVRIAHAHGLSAQTFCDRVFGNSRQIWNRDMDRQAPLWLLQTLSQKTGIPIKAVNRLSLTVYADRLFERRLLSGKQQWLLPLHIYHRIRRGFGTQFCPLCLREDRVPYFRKVWRLALYTFCPKHNAMLHDRCPSCQNAVAFHRQNPMPATPAEFKSLAICTTCGFDLATSANIPVPVWDEEIRRYREYAFAKIEGSRCGKDRWGFSLFPALHHLCKILAGMGRARKNHLFEYVQQQTSAPATLLTLETRALENRPSAERHALLNAAHWLLARWPKRLRRAWENGAVNYSQLLRDGHNLPKWYREGVLACGGRKETEKQCFITKLLIIKKSFPSGQAE